MSARIIVVAGFAAVAWAHTVFAVETLDAFLGKWTVTGANAAPWADGSGATPELDPDLMGKTIVFEAHSASGSPVVACKDTVYTVSEVGPQYLFEGNLPHAATDAVKLGFTGAKIASLNVGCTSSAGDMELDFPMVNHDTLLLGLNNMIYSLERVP